MLRLDTAPARRPAPSLTCPPLGPPLTAELAATWLRPALTFGAYADPAALRGRLRAAGCPYAASVIGEALDAGLLRQDPTTYALTWAGAPAVGPWFSYYAGPITNRRPAVSTTVGALFHALTNPAPRRRELADRVRGAYGTPDYGPQKSRLDYVTPAGTFTHRAADGLLRRSGLLVLDFDHLRDVGAARAALLADPVLRPLLVLLFVSPSGAGLKCLLTVGTDEPHAEAFTVLTAYLALRYGPELPPDRSGRDVCRACFVGYDPAAWVAPAYAPPTP